MEKWVLVTDGDPVSARQKEVCAAVPVGLQGVIECDMPENADAKICSAVEYFPAFCNTKTQSCVYGVRDTKGALEKLSSL